MNAAQLPESKFEAIRYFSNESAAHACLVQMRWPSGVACPHCTSDKVGSLSESTVTSKRTGKITVRRVWNCKACHKQFTAKVGTIFEDSPLSLGVWLSAVWMLVNAKNGVSSYELARDLGITQKSAWHMAHRIREAMREGNFMISGEVEADETYVGAKARFMHKAKWQKFKKTDRAHMTAVAGLLERGQNGQPSRVKATVLPNNKRPTIQGNITKNVLKGSHIISDAFLSYREMDQRYSHDMIDHLVAYANGAIHTNGLENFWALLKRCIKGTYVCPSPFHLARYVDEEATRFNEREENDSIRFANTLKRVSGRKLTYKALTGLALSGPLPA